MFELFKEVNKATVAKLAFLQVFIIVLSNYLVNIPAEAFGIKITYSSFTFPLLILATDLTVRILGKGIARRVIAISYPFAIIGSVAVVMFGGAPDSVAYRIGIASATAYLIGSLLDVYVFQIVREKLTHLWWPAPLISTVIANAIDGYTFMGIAFSNSADEYMASHWVEIATSELFIKTSIGIIVFLPIYGVLLKVISGAIKKEEPTT